MVSSEGAPRDLGRAQGLAAREALRVAAADEAGLRRWLDRAGLVDAGERRFRRDLRRYFPHQHEWLEGVARGAGLPDRTLLRVAIAALDRERRALLIGVEGEAEPLLCRTAAVEAEPRRVHPEGRFASLELASPALASPWIGVNEAGLALVASGGRQPGPCRAHAALLARDCLERFEAVESALAWCLGRPAAPGAAILLADAGGELAGVEFATSGRAVRRAVRGPEGGVLVLGEVRSAELSKRLSAGATGPEDVAHALAATLGEQAAKGAATLDLSTRELRASRDAARLVL